MIKSRVTTLLRRQPVWGLALGVLFLFDFVFYGYMPSHRRLQSLTRARNQHEQAINTAVAQAEALSTLEERHRETVQIVKRYEDCVPTESALGVFLGQIANIMTQHQLTDEEVEPGREVAAGQLNCIPVQMNCTGTLSAIFGFFNDLQSLQRLVRIEKIVLRNGPKFSGTVSMQAEAIIFYRTGTDRGAETSAKTPFAETADDNA